MKSLSFEQISGTALVLDEIINHVQLLQRQVEVRYLISISPSLFFFQVFPKLWRVNCRKFTVMTLSDSTLGLVLAFNDFFPELAFPADLVDATLCG